MKHSIPFAKLFGNKILQYVISRYATYFIQFINSIYIAVNLGPYYLGVWSFISLVLQYISNFNFGIAYSANAIISVNKSKEKYVEKVVCNALFMFLVLSGFILLIFLFGVFWNWNIGSKYEFSDFSIFVAIIAILGHINSLMSNYFRVFGRVFEIAVNQSAAPILMFVTLFLFNGRELLWALVGANLLAALASLLLFLYQSPIKIRPIFVRKLTQLIQIRGWHLFVYNTSFYLIAISSRSFVSAYYSVSEFGYFSFAFSLANVIMLFLEALSFLVYPKLLNRFALSASEAIFDLIVTVRNAYVVVSHGLIHIAIVLFPFFLSFFPDYSGIDGTLKLIALSVVLYTNSFGFQGLMIAKGSEKMLGFIAFVALIVNVFLTWFLVVNMKVAYSSVILSMMFVYFIYVSTIAFWGLRILSKPCNFGQAIFNAFPFRIMLPYVLSLSIYIFDLHNLYNFIPLIVFCLLNFKEILGNKKLLLSIINNPKALDV